MKKSSQWTLGASLVLFLAAGTVKFWPEDRFLPTGPSFPPGSFGGGSPSSAFRSTADMMPLARSFAPGWAEPGPRGGDTAASKPVSTTVMAAPAAPAAPSIPSQSPRRITTTGEASVDKAVSPVSLTAQKMPVGEVLARLFHQTGVSFAPTGQWDEPMTITFANAPMEQALSQTLQLTTSPRLAWHKEKGVYIVMPVANLSPPPSYAPAFR